MTLLGYLLVLTGVVCCTAAPASDPEQPPDSCGPPPRFLDKELQGDWNEKFYNPGKSAQYSCRPGYVRLGAIRYSCIDGKWETVGTLGQCKKKSCGHPGDIEFGTFELKNEDTFVFGAVVEYHCNDGYQMISKHRTRECTATGWTNYRPECEVKFCPPVQVRNNVNLLTTSYEEEYSVGQVIRFECTLANLKLNGASEIFCTSEGTWNAPPPTCEAVKCSPPKIAHGGVSNAKPSYNDKETLDFSCDKGYKPSTSTQITCTKNDWSPTPICEDIVCYRQTVTNGIVLYNKETYRDEETVTLTCNEGYQIEHKPEEPRKCTTHGWSPPLSCISKKCSKPSVQNGYIEESYRFPMSPSTYYYPRYIYFYCDPGFLPSDKDYYGTTYCTKTGWDPEPKCYKRCDVPSKDSINAHISDEASSKIYIEGDKLRFQCYGDYYTANGERYGTIECLPDGKFSGEKCSKTCQKPKLDNMEYKSNENVFDTGAYFTYKCKEGFISSNNKFDGISQCRSNGWQPEPECKGIFCTLTQSIGSESQERRVPFGTVIHLKCPENRTLEGSSSLQCFHSSWSSNLPICRGEPNEESLLFLDSTSPKESKCPIPAPSNARVINPKTEYVNGDKLELECDPNYQLYGSEKGLCKDGKWQSPPWCIERKLCRSNPPSISNGKISEEILAGKYYIGSTVKYVCDDGYHIIGSDESTCMDGNWLPLPTCEGNSCGKPQKILNGKAVDDSKEYHHRERAAYVCFKGYKLSQTEPSSCHLGKWRGVPQCISSSCGPPPELTNGVLKNGQKKNTYFSGERATYECASGYTMGQNTNYITCEDSVWTELPVCKKIGQTCIAPPVVPFGDIEEIRQKTYQSGSSVRYKCANYYKLEGKKEITCKDGEWEKEPVCRVPCTIKEEDMQQNNIQFKHKWGEDKTKKLYSEHFDNMTFECRSGFQISDPKLLRIQCLDGVLKFPRCLKPGTCVLQQTEMTINNIRYNKSTEIENGQSIEFECEEGMVSGNSLQATCRNKLITYPKCSARRSCPPPIISNAILTPETQTSYEPGSSVDIKCEETFVLSGHKNVKCGNGQWDELPQCLKPCTIDLSNLERNHIELLPKESAPEILEHDKEMNVKCKAGFKRPGSPIASCNDGVMKYQRCFSGGTCRISQQLLDENFLELDEKHENEVFYGEGETISFKCKTGYRNRSGLNKTCTKNKKQPTEYILTYPKCA